MREAALLGILPEALRPLVDCSYFVASHHDIPPHIDDGIRISLNHYVVTADATTTFYCFRQTRPRVEHLENNDPGSASGCTGGRTWMSPGPSRTRRRQWLDRT